MVIKHMFADAKDVIALLLAKKKSSASGSASEENDRVNIMLAGKSGVGKSTLLNAIFGEDFATTGVGAPVTHHFDVFEKDGVPLCIYDVRGLELDPAVQKNIRSEMKKLIKASLKTEDKNDDVHLIWYCVASSGTRLEKFEIDFIKDLSKQLDVVLVITKSYDNDETLQLMSYIEGEKERGNLPYVAIVPVLAKDRSIDGAVVKEQFGLKELTKLSYELLPTAQKRAFAAAQKVSNELKKKAAYTVITLASAAAAATGAIPIPIADAAVLVPIQRTMFIGIANAYGVKFEGDDFTKFVAAIAPDAAVTLGKSAVVSLLKLVPGVGGAAVVVSGSVAAAMTAALGTAFQTALENGIREINLDAIIPEEFAAILKKNFEAALKDMNKESARKGKDKIKTKDKIETK